MKKPLLYVFVALIAFAGCKKDDKGIDQLALSIQNMTKLVGKSSSYIKQASPGEFDEEDADFVSFTIDEEAPDLTDGGFLIYFMDDDVCFLNQLTSYNWDDLNAAEELMGIAVDELGADAEEYYLGYTDELAGYCEEYFDNMDSLWQFVADSSLLVEDIDLAFALFHYTDYYVFAGGFYASEIDKFDPVIEVGDWNDWISGKSATNQASSKKRTRYSVSKK